MTLFRFSNFPPIRNIWIFNVSVWKQFQIFPNSYLVPLLLSTSEVNIQQGSFTVTPGYRKKFRGTRETSHFLTKGKGRTRREDGKGEGNGRQWIATIPFFLSFPLLFCHLVLPVPVPANTSAGLCYLYTRDRFQI